MTDSPALAGGSLSVPSAAGPLFVLDADTGTIDWAGSAGSEITGAPAVSAGRRYVGTADGRVVAFAL